LTVTGEGRLEVRQDFSDHVVALAAAELMAQRIQ